MASDVTEDEDGGRYRGLDIDEESFDENYENTTEIDIPDRKHNEIPIEIGTSASFMQQRLKNQAETIAKLQKSSNEEHRKEATWKNFEEVENLKKTIADQAAMIIKLQEMLKCGNGNEEEATGNETKKRKRGDVSDVINMEMVADSFNKDAKIRELTDEIKLLKNELHVQKNLTTSNCKKVKPTVADKHTEAKTRMLPDRPTPNVESLFQEMQSKMDHQMVQMKEFIQTSIDEKLEKHINKSQTMTGVSFSSIVSGEKNETKSNKAEDFRSIMLATKNEELVEQRDKAFRERNLIVHGVEESNTENDSVFIKTLITNVVSQEIKPINITRLGAENKDKRRPIKVSLNTELEKGQVMSNLANLKGNEAYKRISVTEDYTISERKMIQEMRDQVRTKNDAEPENSEFVYRLRGTPKNGLQIRRFKKSREDLASVNAVQSTTQLAA